MGDDRPADRVVAHYRLERELSDRLRNASRESRSLVYRQVYGELFAALPDHPQRRIPGNSPARLTAMLREIAGNCGPKRYFSKSAAATQLSPSPRRDESAWHTVST